MSKLLGWLAATTIGAAIVAVTPAVAFQGSGFGGGMGGMRMGRQVFVAGAPRFVCAPFAGRHLRRKLGLRVCSMNTRPAVLFLSVQSTVAGFIPSNYVVEADDESETWALL